jgi:hypothetical protein
MRMSGWLVMVHRDWRAVHAAHQLGHLLLRQEQTAIGEGPELGQVQAGTGRDIVIELLLGAGSDLFNLQCGVGAWHAAFPLAVVAGGARR